MKKILVGVISFFMLASASALHAANIGVPAECEDVMLQAFYWDSHKTQSATDSKFGRTKWMDLIKDTTEIRDNFDLVWFPPSAKSTGGVGYYHTQLSNQDSDWGTKTMLKNLIAGLHRGNTKVIADIVINHRGSVNGWCQFAKDNFGTYGSYQLTSKHVCKGDECFTDSKSDWYNKPDSVRGATDSGSNDSGARDLDHKSEYVQNWAKAYTQWILKTMAYDGFRYDMTLGFHGRYLKMYNEASNPYISVSELWESISRQKQHLQECDYNTMVFDFQQKYVLKTAFVQGGYGALKKNTNSFRGQGLERYAVTFIDNHDTFDRGGAYGDNQFTNTTDLTNATAKNQVLQASAYLMMMPGIPCVFYPHWASYKEEIKELIAVRKRAGIHSESQVITESSGQYKYTATVQGHRGQVVIRVGKYRDMTVPEGFELAVEGGDRGDYTVYVKDEAQGLTDVEESMLRSEKFIEGGKIMIRRGEHVYDVLGRKIK